MAKLNLVCISVAIFALFAPIGATEGLPSNDCFRSDDCKGQIFDGVWVCRNYKCEVFNIDDGESDYKVIRFDEGEDIPDGWTIVESRDPAMEMLIPRFLPGRQDEMDLKSGNIAIITNNLELGPFFLKAEDTVTGGDYTRVNWGFYPMKTKMIDLDAANVQDLMSKAKQSGAVAITYNPRNWVSSAITSIQGTAGSAAHSWPLYVRNDLVAANWRDLTHSSAGEQIQLGTSDPSKDEVKAMFRAAFAQVDTDQDGQIRLDQFVDVIEATDAAPYIMDIIQLPSAYAAVADAEGDGDNMLTADEIVNLWNI